MVEFKVKFHAYHRRLTGLSETTLQAPDGTTAEQAVELVWRTWMPLARDRRSTVVLLNRSPMTGAEVIHDGDLLELLPPVAGG